MRGRQENRAHDGSPESVVDLVRYPIEDLDAPAARAIVRDARGQLAATGAVDLPACIRAEPKDAVAAEGRALAPLAHRHAGVSAAYLGPPDDDLPEAHPRRVLTAYALGAVAYDLYPAGSPVRALLGMAAADRVRGGGARAGTAVPRRRPAGRTEHERDARRRRLGLALRPDRFRGVARGAGVRRGRRFPRGAAHPHAGRRTLRRRAPRAHRRAGATAHAAHDARHAAYLRGARLAASRDARAGPTPRVVALFSYDTKPGATSTDLLRLARYGRTA